MAVLTRSQAAVVRQLRDLRIEVEAADPGVLAAILRELPVSHHPSEREGIRLVAGDDPLSISVAEIGAEEEPPYHPGEWGTDYHLEGNLLHLRAPLGTRFRADSGTGHLTIASPPVTGGLLEAEISAGMSTALPFLLRKWGLFGVHAAAVRCPYGLLLLPGLSGSGKSTTAGRLAAEGLPLLSDDLVLLTRQPGWAFPFARQPRFRPDALYRFPELASVGLGEPLLEPVRALVFPRLDPERSSELQHLSQREALAALLECSLLLGPPAQVREHFRLLAHLARLPSYRLWLGTGASRLASLLGQDGPGTPACLKH